MERVSVSHVISEKFMGETLSVTVLRNEKVQNVLVTFLQAETAFMLNPQFFAGTRRTNYCADAIGCKHTLQAEVPHMLFPLTYVLTEYWTGSVALPAHLRGG